MFIVFCYLMTAALRHNATQKYPEVRGSTKEKNSCSLTDLDFPGDAVALSTVDGARRSQISGFCE